MLTVLGCVADKRESKAVLSVGICDGFRKSRTREIKRKLKSDESTKRIARLICFSRIRALVAGSCPFDFVCIAIVTILAIDSIHTRCVHISSFFFLFI